jgi:hypothetical protein
MHHVRRVRSEGRLAPEFGLITTTLPHILYAISSCLT